MWLCDSLPHDLPGARIIIYGYNTQLHGSQSFQDLEVLGSTLRSSIDTIYRFGQVSCNNSTLSCFITQLTVCIRATH
jgi:hypothetical protein